MANSLCFTSFNTCNTAGILINPTKALVVNQALKSSRSARIRSLEAKAVEKNPTTIVYARCEGDAKREARKEAQSRTGKMKLEVYADRMSQPSRAVIIFCKVNGIDYTELKEDTSKREHLTPEFAEINPMKQLPAIVDGKFKLFESHSILIYLACAFPGVADHWYPADLFKRNTYVINTTILPALGYPSNQQAADEAEKFLVSSLSEIESFWLKGDGPFLLGGNQPSIADLSLVCELMQLEVLNEKYRYRLLGPYKKVQRWIKHTRYAISPHFGDVNKNLMNVKEKLKNKPLMEANHGGVSVSEQWWRARM